MNLLVQKKQTFALCSIVGTTLLDVSPNGSFKLRHCVFH